MTPESINKKIPYRVTQITSVSINRGKHGYIKVTIPKFYADLIELNNKDKVIWETDGEYLRFKKVK